MMRRPGHFAVVCFGAVVAGCSSNPDEGAGAYMVAQAFSNHLQLPLKIPVAAHGVCSVLPEAGYHLDHHRW